jgi:hypothetical protein
MDIFREAFNEATLDLIERLTAENNHLTRITQVDDVLEVAVQLVDSVTGKRLSSLKNFIDKMKSEHNADYKAVKYRSKVGDSFISVADYKELTNKSGWLPVYLIHCKSDEHTIIEYSENILSIRIHNLSHWDKPRYWATIRALIGSGLFEFKHRTEPNEKRVYNASRQVIRRQFYINRYEWGLILDPEISAVIHGTLNRMIANNEPGIRREINTVYLYDSKESQCKIKIYNITAAQKSRLGDQPEFRPGDRLKFEITYKHEYFRKHKVLTVNLLTMQNVIADLLYNDNKRLFNTHLISKLKPQEFRDLFTAAAVNNRSEFMELFSDTKTVQIATDKRLAEIEYQIAQLKQTMTDQAEVQANQADELEKLKAFVGYTESKQDTRKLRSIK